MLRAFHKAPLLVSPDGELRGYFSYLEAFKYRDRDDSFDAKPLLESDVSNWAQQKGDFVSNSKVEGGIRLIFAEPMSTFRQAVPTALVDAQVLEYLHLPSTTFASYQQTSGVFSYHTYPQGSTIDTCQRLSLVFRTPQKKECSTGALAISHDFETKITTGLILGHGLHIRHYNHGLSDLSSQCSDHNPDKARVLEEFLGDIKDWPSLWLHPLLIPVLFLVTHAQRVRSFILEAINYQVIEIESAVGVTKAGRSLNEMHNRTKDLDSQRLFVDNKFKRNRARELMRKINDASTGLIFTRPAPEWNKNRAVFISELLENTKRFHILHGREAQMFSEVLDFLKFDSTACAEACEISKARLQLQLDIVYVLTNQDDAQTNVRIAALAHSFTKIISYITAGYLPATWLASLFSMDMFTWRLTGGRDGTNSDGNQTTHTQVSPDFWIYWVATAGLTFVTLVALNRWWKLELKNVDKKVDIAGGEHPAPSLKESVTVATVRKSHFWQSIPLRRLDSPPSV